MTKRLGLFCVAFALIAGRSAAQDAKAVLQAASKAMGADKLTSIQISGTGMVAAVGQSYSSLEPHAVLDAANDDWPRFEVTSYTRTVDYGAKSSLEEMIRRQGNNRARGGGGTPLQGEQKRTFVVNDKYAWNVQDGNVNPALDAAEVRQLDIWLTPHGFLKAALASGNPTAISRPQGARTVTIVSFLALGKYRVNGTISDQNMVELVQTWIANPVLGDMLYETRYTDYRDYGGVKFPTVLHTHQGDFGLYPADNSMEIRVTNVQPNLAAPPPAVPDAVRRATVPVVRVATQQLATGVWLIGGGSHHSVAVEFLDFVTVVEAPLNDERSLAVIAEVHKLAPGKPIRYVVNTHQHFDHVGGLRAYVSEGATVVTHERNREFYEHVVFRPGTRTLEPDRLSLYPRALAMETTSQKYTISDGVRTLDLYPVQGLAHAATMLVAYLPKEKILVNADLYSPAAPGAPAVPPSAATASLYQNIQRLKLDVAVHVPIHGVTGTGDQLVQIMKKPGA